MKKYKNLIFVALLIGIIICLSIIFSAKQSNFNTLKQMPFKSIEISPGEQVYTYNQHIYIYGKSGLKILKETEVLLEDAFTLENPIVATSFDKIAICDDKGKVVRVYSNSGLIYTVNTVNNVLGFSINKNGFLGLILKSGDNYEIEIYNNNGDSIYSIKDISYEQGIPVCLSISEDNKTLGVSSVKTSEANIITNISFYSMSDNQVFGGFVKENQIAGIIKLTQKNTLVGVSEQEIFAIKINPTQSNETVKEIYKKPLNNIVKHFYYLDGVGYVVCYGEALNKEQSMANNSVVFYNQTSGEIGKYIEKEQQITNIFPSSFGVVLQKGRLFTAVSTTGKKLWQYQATQDIKQVNFYNDANKAIIVTNDEIKIVKIDKTLVDKQIDENASTESETESTSKDNDNMTETTTSKDDDNKTETTTSKNSNNKIETTTSKDKDKTTQMTTKDNNKQTETTTKDDNKETTT